jgi:hypothetical protein
MTKKGYYLTEEDRKWLLSLRKNPSVETVDKPFQITIEELPTTEKPDRIWYAKIPPGGIAARVGVTVSSALCEIYSLQAALPITDTTRTLDPVYNPSGSIFERRIYNVGTFNLEASSYYPITLSNTGDWVAIGQESSTDVLFLDLLQSGGEEGGPDDYCSWTYNVRIAEGTEIILPAVDPGIYPHKWRRSATGSYEPASFGMGRYNAVGDLIIVWTNEVPYTKTCEGSRVTRPVDIGDPNNEAGVIINNEGTNVNINKPTILDPPQEEESEGREIGIPEEDNPLI